jgi:hypothetical protein
MYPVGRGSLWYVVEDVWEEANPSYAAVRNPERNGHPGLAGAALTAVLPTTVPLFHGHSGKRNREDWFHLRVTGISPDNPSHETWFDVWHRYPVAWREFFTERVQRNLDKKALSGEETLRLDDIETLIRTRTQLDCSRAISEYQRHPAWKKHFPESLSAPPLGASEGAAQR